MNHAVVTEHLADYLEGDLALDLRALVDAHLDTCEICGQEVREMQQTIRLLRALPEPETPPMIAANVMRRIRAGETRLGLLERIQRVLGGVLEPSFVLPASAVAVAALVIVAIQGGGPLSVSFRSPGQQAESSFAQTPTAPVNPVVGSADELDRGFGASAARELAAAPGTVGRPSSAESEDRQGMARLAEPLTEDGVPSSTLAARDAMTATPWQPEQMRRGLAPRRAAPESFFGDPVLAQGFASEVAGPGASAPTNRVSDELGTAMPLALSRRVPAGGQGLGAEGSGGEDPRDLWLARALAQPADFARYIAGHNLAEQELWVERLAERAQARGLLGELVDALRGAGDEKAVWLADDFAAQASTAKSGDPEAVSSGTETAEAAEPGR